VVYSPFGYDTFRIRRANGYANGVGGAAKLPSPSSTMSFLTLLSRNDWYNVSTSRAGIRQAVSVHMDPLESFSSPSSDILRCQRRFNDIL